LVEIEDETKRLLPHKEELQAFIEEQVKEIDAIK
jgi:hypothetical protein